MQLDGPFKGTAPLSLSEASERITEISTLPAVALRILEVARDPDAGARDLKKAVEGDPAMSARVLRTVNSAAYGLSTHVTNLHQAISLLGFGQVRNLALTASVSTVFKGESKIGVYDRQGLWRHLVSVGLCARLVAVRCRLPDFEDAFLAGLLHDIGIVLEDQHLHEEFVAVAYALNESQTLCQVEEDLLGFTHAQLGDNIAERWRFPDVVRAAIRHHHDSSRHRGEHLDILRCIEIANVICTLKGISAVGIKNVRCNVEVFQAMGFGKRDITVLAADLDRELRQSETLFDLC